MLEQEDSTGANTQNIQASNLTKSMVPTTLGEDSNIEIDLN